MKWRPSPPPARVRTGRWYPFYIGKRQARVLINALTEYAIHLGYEVGAGDPSAVAEQRIVLNMRDRLERKLRKDWII